LRALSELVNRIAFRFRRFILSSVDESISVWDLEHTLWPDILRRLNEVTGLFGDWVDFASIALVDIESTVRASVNPALSDYLQDGIEAKTCRDLA